MIEVAHLAQIRLLARGIGDGVALADDRGEAGQQIRFRFSGSPAIPAVSRYSRRFHRVCFVGPGIVDRYAGVGEVAGVPSDDGQPVGLCGCCEKQIGRIACVFAAHAKLSGQAAAKTIRISVVTGSMRLRVEREHFGCRSILSAACRRRVIGDGGNAVEQLRYTHDADRDVVAVPALQSSRITPLSGRFRTLSEMMFVSRSHFTSSVSSNKSASKISKRLSRKLPNPARNRCPRRALDTSSIARRIQPLLGLRLTLRPDVEAVEINDATARLPCTVTSCGSPSRALRTTSEKRAFASWSFQVFAVIL